MLVTILGCIPIKAEDRLTTALDDARSLLLTGKYEEAAEAFGRAAESQPIESALGTAQAKASVGQLDDARRALETAIAKTAADKSTDIAALHGELSRLAFDRGDYVAAEKHAKDARSIDDENLLGRWIGAELQRVTGHLDEADKSYRWFIDYYNAHDVSDAGSLIIIGQAAAQHARWNRASDQFGFLINDLYPEAIKHEPACWQAHYQTGLLFLEKFNQAEASRELKLALAMNPGAAEVHAALAHLALQRYDMDQAGQSIARALAINPNLRTARLAKADLMMANFEADEAAKYLSETLVLNPVDEETLGRVAATDVVINGYHPVKNTGADDSRLGKLLTEVNSRNPHAGVFYYTLATRLEERRQFTAAADFFRTALERMPRLVGPHAGLGMMHMRLGEEADARKLLDEAFAIDPFNVRVSNTLQVLEVLDGYQTMETEHFLIRYDAEKDKLLAHYAAAHLERVYPDLCQLLGYRPTEKSLFEIFNHAKNTNGHGWFSARTIGLPYIGTVGACTGKMVAMASPNEGKTKFNWARVLKHEFVHVINLQQTNFNIPHWFTEALAVWNEGFPRPQEWNRLLVARVPKGETFNLDTINLGFIRPESSENWQMAYCQAELYAEYLLKEYGNDAFAKLLTAYAENLDTRSAIKRCFGVEQEKLEAGYTSYLNQIVAGLKQSGEEAPATMAEIEAAAATDPENPDKLARLAAAQFDRKNYPEARKLARKAVELKPKHQLASFVIAQLNLLVGDDAEAMLVLEQSLDRNAPDSRLVTLLAGLKLKASAYDEAATLYQMMSDRQPDEIRWVKSLARVYLLSKQDQPLVPVLERLAELDADDLAVRKKLADLALKRKDYATASHWSHRALDIDVMDLSTHRTLAQALTETGDHRAAVTEYEVASELAPNDLALLYSLADAYRQAADMPRAYATAEQLMKRAPDYPGAKELLEQTKP